MSLHSALQDTVKRLEDATGGIVILRAGGSVLLYSGEGLRDRKAVQKAYAAREPQHAAMPLPSAGGES